MELYAKWLRFADLVDEYKVSFLKRIDIGWFYLLCGLLLTVAAIVLPAQRALRELETKRVAIQNDFTELQYQIGVYESFLEDLHKHDSELQDRVFEMQMRINPAGASVVIDASASKTPLEWVAQRARRDRFVDMNLKEDSILTGLSSGRSRLFLVGIGAFSMFIGFMKNQTHPEQLSD